MPGCAMSDVAAHSAVDRTTLTRNIDQLVAAGLVERRIAPRDRRQASLDLSARGKAVCERATALVAGHDAALFAEIPAADLECATRVLQRLVTGLAGERAAAILAFAGPGGGAPHAAGG